MFWFIFAYACAYDYVASENQTLFVVLLFIALHSSKEMWRKIEEEKPEGGDHWKCWPLDFRNVGCAKARFVLASFRCDVTTIERRTQQNKIATS